MKKLGANAARERVAEMQEWRYDALTGAISRKFAFADFAQAFGFMAEVALAAEKNCRPGQLALAWLLAQPLDVVPIPGTKRAEYVRENLAATNVAISADEVAYLADVFAPSRVVGERYAPTHAAHVETAREE